MSSINKTQLSIVLDGMGSDNYPIPELLGAIQASSELKHKIIITGDKSLIESKLKEITYNKSAVNIEIIHAPERITTEEAPAFSSRSKINSSIGVGMDLVKTGKADAFVSAGNTGAILASGLIMFRRIKNTRRPAIAVQIPTPHKGFVLLDVGANSDCQPAFLHQFAIMGNIYAKKLLDIQSPRIALLSNGEERSKGNELIKKSHRLIETNQSLNFLGNVEAKEIFNGDADVVITDGFTGNIALKVTESVASMVTQIIKDAIKSTPMSIIGGLLVKKSIQSQVQKLDPNETGGAPLLGLNEVVIVGHGRSNGLAIKNAINVAAKAVNENLIQEISEAIVNTKTD
ncbi:MAG TPA: phosphate acyltransferase PlsX [Chloroflexi bacterium]|nr:phosphate acyltransferase PlsX [Chloroflexota bacterium]|tara:strand:+ start:698 stop:1729 length:1032 start_codon:yes stop_codon:yes gene_type:complete